MHDYVVDSQQMRNRFNREEFYIQKMPLHRTHSKQQLTAKCNIAIRFVPQEKRPHDAEVHAVLKGTAFLTMYITHSCMHTGCTQEGTEEEFSIHKWPLHWTHAKQQPTAK